ncbi:MAG TPA: MBL fold metallo-hydrolase [Chitinophagaceae bacterium]|nr:MBL fold metallo-hydrolase [Chitinophagaceae bacterium]
MENSFNVIYIGGPTAIFEIDGLRFMTDPTLDPAGETYHSGDLIHTKIKGPAAIDLGHIDFVLLSHDQHYDNLDKAGRVFIQKIATTYSTIPAAERLKGSTIGMKTWETISIPTPGGSVLEITSTPARHGPAGSERLQGQVTGFMITLKKEPSLQFYITGDTVFYEGVTEVAQRYTPSYVFIFAGAAQPRGPFVVTMRTNDAIDTAMAFPTATIIPLHFEGWKHLTQNAEDIKQSYQVLNMQERLKILEPAVVTALPY